MSWIMLGLLLTAGAALAFVLVLSTTGSRVSVLAAARDLQPGQQIKATDLRVVSVSADESVKSVPADQAAELVGRVPLAPLAGGTLLHSGLFATGSDLGANETVVGAALRPGDLPGSNLRPGDRVALVQVASTNPTDSGQSTVLAVGTVYSLVLPKDTGDIVVAVRLPIDRGAAAANAAGRKRLRLLLVPPDASLEQLTAADDAAARPSSASGSGTSSGSSSSKPATSVPQPTKGN